MVWLVNMMLFYLQIVFQIGSPASIDVLVGRRDVANRSPVGDRAGQLAF